MTFINFLFEKLLPITDVQVILKRKNDQITMMLIPRNKALEENANLVPLSVTATPEELDTNMEEIMKSAIPALKTAISNVEEFVKSCEAKKNKEEKPKKPAPKETPVEDPPDDNLFSVDPSATVTEVPPAKKIVEDIAQEPTEETLQDKPVADAKTRKTRKKPEEPKKEEVENKPLPETSPDGPVITDDQVSEEPTVNDSDETPLGVEEDNDDDLF